MTINVQVPVIDDSYPSDTGRSPRVYIPAGIQHMTGAQALVYARSRHGSDDFDRGYRQQRVLTSLREQANIAEPDPADPGAPRRLQGDRQDGHPAGRAGEAGGARGQRRHEEHPLVRVLVPALRDADPAPRSTSTCPNVTKIRAAVANAFKVDPQLEDTRAALGDENGSIWVLNGGGRPGQAQTLAATSTTTG